MAVVESPERHQDLVDELIDAVAAYNPEVDGELLARAFRYAEKAHEGQQRRSGEEFILHPWGAAKILAELRLGDEPMIAAALLHDVVEDTGSDIGDVRAEFGDEIAKLVEGVTKLTRITFQSREQAEAENYRKMIMAMAEDERVILIKLADRLHNMRTIEYLGKQKQIQKAKETLEVYAPLAHRLGIHALKWELEDLAFERLHPRKYEEITAMVSERRADRDEHVGEAARVLQAELDKVDIPADISARAKHFYSIYDKMAKKGREFNEIYDLTAMRVIVERSGEEGTRDCYGALGLIHSLWKPMPGRFKDFVAMPKFNGYRSLHTTVIGPEGRPLEIQVRTREMHDIAEYGIAAHWLYKRGKGRGPRDSEWGTWVRQLMDAGENEADPREFLKSFRTDLFDEEVFVFTPKGEVKTLPSGGTPIDFAYSVHTDVGHRTVGAKVNGRIVPLHYRLKSGDIVEILTSKTGRGPSRDWMTVATSSRARNKIRQWFSRETREDTEQKGREGLEHALKAQNLPYRKLAGSVVMAQVIRDSGYKKAEDFYLALGSGKLSATQIVNKVLQRLKTDQVAEEETVPLKRPKERHAISSDGYGINVHGVDDVLVRLANCCTPVPGDEIVGYISLGRGITIHRGDCPNVKALKRNPERFTQVEWDGAASQSFRVQVAVDSWDRPRLLEDVARTFAEHGANIVSYGGSVEDQLAKNWYTVEVGDVKALRALLSALRNIDAVFDAYRVTPS
ncbi:MAG: diphosphokinase / guanosine-3,5-bis(diphosphate) 3-diphosphatase [Gaiellaceae bacterium]|nr:diphosphokinase / guanosine-3,5-bis(diphosphate) 3-diphosphatase [Gaiellaceae bacterium]